MIVYGDKKRWQPTAEKLARIARLRKRALGVGINRHALLSAMLIESGELVQGVADVNEEQGARLHPSLLRIARSFIHSFNAPAKLRAELPTIDTAGVDLPQQIEVSRAEGFAYYALYPEQYVLAARPVRADHPVVIGLRSIGTTLGAVVAATVDAELFVTVRPSGHPSHRELQLAAEIEAELLRGRSQRTYLVVDEGPGLSGSSMVAVGKWLEERGVSRRQIIVLPSHGNGPGIEATENVRAYWRSVRVEVASFDDVFLMPDAPLQLAETLRVDALGEISGGAWRELRSADAPVNAQQERRKFIGRRDGIAVIAKFIGLDAAADEAIAVARRLGDAGFVPRLLDVRYGFAVTEWPDASRDEQEAFELDRIADYLAFRRREFPTARRGASVLKLLEMAEHNAQRDLSFWRNRVDELDAARECVVTDNRMHRWEWVRDGEGTLLKCDSADHAFAHDLIGPQDIAWDVMGAVVELGLEVNSLIDALSTRGVRVNRELFDFYAVAYAAFQLGYYDMAAASATNEEKAKLIVERERYRTLLQRNT